MDHENVSDRIRKEGIIYLKKILIYIYIYFYRFEEKINIRS